MTSTEIQNALSGLPQDSNWYRAIQVVIGFHLAANTQAALQPGLEDAARHYNAGRAAGVEDLLVDLDQRITGPVKRP